MDNVGRIKNWVQYNISLIAWLMIRVGSESCRAYFYAAYLYDFTDSRESQAAVIE